MRLLRTMSVLARRREVQMGVLTAGLMALLGQGCPPPNTGGNGGNNGGPTPPTALSGRYAGSDSCYTCHARVHDDWKLTNHNRSFQALKDLGQDQNAVCLTCHTTGFGQDGGFTGETQTPQLAHVGCESCHGPSGEHVRNVADQSLRPTVSISANVCAQCHNGFHHDTFSEWQSSRHGRVTPDEAEAFANGQNLNNCGTCHSGDFRFVKFIQEQATVSDALLAGRAHEDMNAVSCAICHNPHRNTGNAKNPPLGHDFQLRYPETVTELPQSNAVADNTNPGRFNLCGQCHHDRGRTWTENSRPPHHSVQANFYRGEMPTPDGLPSLVANRNTVHRFVEKQCVTCHMQPEPEELLQDFTGGAQPYVRHTYKVDSLAGCITSSCHPTEASVQADIDALTALVNGSIDAIKARLGDPSTWEYTAEGGPNAEGQKAIPDAIKKARYLIHYIESDGSHGTHNPEYTRDILQAADVLLTGIGK